MPVTEPRHYTETIPGLTQAKLCMLFTTGTPEDLPSISQLRVAMGVFGGSATSRLFRNVREKQSLCYYCGSSAAFHRRDDGGFRCGTGGEERAEAAILKELDDLCRGPVDRGGDGRTAAAA